VDDEPHLSFLVQVVLEGAGYLVATAPNGEVALRLVAAASTQLVVTDRMMPVMNGPALVARLRADPRTASIPIVMMSSNPDTGAAVDAFLDKPFEPEELVQLVERLISAIDKGTSS
jgi:CheY-like chemotaxis protein